MPIDTKQRVLPQMAAPGVPPAGGDTEEEEKKSQNPLKGALAKIRAKGIPDEEQGGGKSGVASQMSPFN